MKIIKCYLIDAKHLKIDSKCVDFFASKYPKKQKNYLFAYLKK